MFVYAFSNKGERSYNHDFSKVYLCPAGFVLCVCDGVGDDPNSGIFANSVGEKVFSIAKKILKTSRTNKRKLFLQKKLKDLFENLPGDKVGQTTVTLAVGTPLSSRKRATCHYVSLGDSRLYSFSSLHGGICMTSDDVDDQGRIARYLDARRGLIGEIAVRKSILSSGIYAIAAVTDGMYEACSTEELDAFMRTCAISLPINNELLNSWSSQFLGKNISDNFSMAAVFSQKFIGERP